MRLGSWDHSGDITRIPQKDRPTETALQSKANTHNTQGNCVAHQQSMAGHCDLAIISFGSSHSPTNSRSLSRTHIQTRGTHRKPKPPSIRKNRACPYVSLGSPGKASRQLTGQARRSDLPPTPPKIKNSRSADHSVRSADFSDPGLSMWLLVGVTSR